MKTRRLRICCCAAIVAGMLSGMPRRAVGGRPATRGSHGHGRRHAIPARRHHDQGRRLRRVGESRSVPPHRRLRPTGRSTRRRSRRTSRGPTPPGKGRHRVRVHPPPDDEGSHSACGNGRRQICEYAVGRRYMLLMFDTISGSVNPGVVTASSTRDRRANALHCLSCAAMSS